MLYNMVYNSAIHRCYALSYVSSFLFRRAQANLRLAEAVAEVSYPVIYHII